MDEDPASRRRTPPPPPTEDRKLAYMRGLYDTARALVPLADMPKMASVFLTRSMEVLGVSHGAVLFVDEERGADMLVTQGFSPDQRSALEKDRAALVGHVRGIGAFPGEDVRQGSCRDVTMPLPRGVCLVSTWTGPGETVGLIALGTPESGRDHDAGDAEFLRSLSVILAGSLERALQRRIITDLNQALTERNQKLTTQNEELQQLLNDVSACRVEVDNIAESRERILTAVRREVSRLGQVRVMDFVFIILLSFLVGALFNQYSPNKVDLVPQSLLRAEAEHVEVERAFQRLEDGAMFVDARPAELYRKGHVRGAVNAPSNLFDFVYAMRFASLDREREIIVYGHTVSRPYDEDVAYWLTEKGFTNVRVMAEGMALWREKGYPVGP